MEDYEHFIYRSFLGDAKIIWDVGACIGRFTSFFAGLEQVEQVIAFEPFTANYDELQANTKDNHKVTTIRAALSDKNYNAVTTFRNCRTDGLAAAQDDIPYRKLLDLIEKENIPICQMGKMDVEMAESWILLDILELYKQGHKMTWCVEMHVQPRGDLSDCSETNPAFRYPEEGGININDFKPYCNIYTHRAHSYEYSLANENDDLNPTEGYYGMFIFQSK